MSAVPLRVDIWSDFVCPFCFIGALRLEQLAAQRALALHWHAFQLRPAGAPPMDAAKREWIGEHTPRLAAQMREEFGLDIKRGPLDIDTRAAHRLFAASLEAGKGVQLHDALFRAYWLQGEDISDPNVLAAIAAKNGFDGTTAISGHDQASERSVAADLAQAAQYGFQGVPALVFGRKYYVSGAQPLAVFAQAAEQAASEQDA
ncbi:MAG: DsbA family oxidoreductase [Proteobacteria bacterium]|uniref:DsbA family protein n=1 Tax=Rudaea sp. TaxID=2136325 RepID=UPI001DC215CB|nr:DsbA family oxidoreductase [Pseudomonadota bacterium]MBS0567853.1 DsbA family oxidoreductase [Pseudomonadota bacterium]